MNFDNLKLCLPILHAHSDTSPTEEIFLEGSPLLDFRGSHSWGQWYIVDEGDCYSRCQFLEGENTKKEFLKEKGESYFINIDNNYWDGETVFLMKLSSAVKPIFWGEQINIATYLLTVGKEQKTLFVVGGHGGLRYWALFKQYFGIFYFNVRYCGII